MTIDEEIKFWQARLFHAEPERCDYGRPWCPCKEESGCKVCEVMDRFYFGEEPVNHLRVDLQLAIVRKFVARLQHKVDELRSESE